MEKFIYCDGKHECLIYNRYLVGLQITGMQY